MRGRERDRKRESEREKEIERVRERKKERERVREGERERERERERETRNDIITCIARADSRFSANEEILVEGSLVARRMVSDGVMNESLLWKFFC